MDGPPPPKKPRLKVEEQEESIWSGPSWWRGGSPSTVESYGVEYDKPFPPSRRKIRTQNKTTMDGPPPKKPHRVKLHRLPKKPPPKKPCRVKQEMMHEMMDGPPPEKPRRTMDDPPTLVRQEEEAMDPPNPPAVINIKVEEEDTEQEESIWSGPSWWRGGSPSTVESYGVEYDGPFPRSPPYSLPSVPTFSDEDEDSESSLTKRARLPGGGYCFTITMMKSDSSDPPSEIRWRQIMYE